MKLLTAAAIAACSALAAIAVVGPLSARAVEPVLHFEVCLERVNGIYEDSICRKITGTMVYEKYGLTSKPETVESTQASGFELETSISGTATLIKCTAQSSTGTAWNPEPFETSSGEGAGVVTFEGCTVSNPLGCAIPGKSIVTKELKASLEEHKTLGPGVKLTPSGEVFAEVKLEKCSKAEFNKTYSVKGSDFGIANEESVLEFINASSSLTFGGAEALLRGESTQSDGEGNSLLIS